MTDYTKLVKALRILQDKNSLSYYKRRVCKDAADAIEELQAEIRESMQKCAECGDRMVEPKRGEWIEDTTTYAGPGLSNYKCSLCGKICGTWRMGLKPIVNCSQCAHRSDEYANGKVWCDELGEYHECNWYCPKGEV